MPNNIEKPSESKFLEEEKVIETLDLNDDELEYLKNLRTRLEFIRDEREKPRYEYDDMTYSQRWQLNEDLANIRILPKKNKSDVQYQSGTLRTKLFAFISSLIGLNLQGDISAYDINDIRADSLGSSMEDIVAKTKEIENDEEKQLVRWYEMMKQGDVFTEEVWNDKWITEGKVDSKYNGQFRYKVNRRKIKIPGNPVSNILSGLSVYLGDMTVYDIQDQPDIYTVEVINYEEAKSIYEGFENFKYVRKDRTPFMGGDSAYSILNNNWRLTDTTDNQVEVIKYSNKNNHEYQIILNGVPMLPIGFPFPWGHRNYNIAQQHYKPIRHNFCYGQSFIFENKMPVQLLDEMMKLAYLKTEKSFLPSYINTSSRVITSEVFRPGRITMGIKPGDLQPLSEKEVQGVTNAEFNMVQELQRDIDRRTSSQTFTGSAEQGDPTATQIIELQRQARVMLGITIFAASKLEEKMLRLRLCNILKNWFRPIDTVVNETRTELKNRYRIVSSVRPIDNEGMGVRYVVPTDNLPTVQELMDFEDKMTKDTGVPTRVIALNPQEIEESKYIWNITIVPREKRTSETSKLMFNSMVQSAMSMGLKPDLEFLQQRFAETWEENPSKMFPVGTISTEVNQPGNQSPGGISKAELITPSFEAGSSTPV